MKNRNVNLVFIASAAALPSGSAAAHHMLGVRARLQWHARPTSLRLARLPRLRGRGVLKQRSISMQSMGVRLIA